MLATTLRTITDEEFQLFQALIFREAGIYLSPTKKALLVGRLAKRLRILGLGTFGAYYKWVTDSEHASERTQLLDCICTNETRFFREPKQFEYLEEEIVPELKAIAEAHDERKLRVWSAACSTGEEPYSIAMLLCELLPPSAGWQLEILATDLSTRALQAAELGQWNIERATEIPERYLKKYMLRGIRSQEGTMVAGSVLRSLVSFQHLNLNDDASPLSGVFDLIFCRNVLIYFNLASKTRVVQRLLRHLVPTGYLFVGHAESLSGITDEVRPVRPNIYHRNGTGRWPRRQG